MGFTRAAAAGAAAGLGLIGLTAGAATATENGALAFDGVDPVANTAQVWRIGAGGGALKNLTQGTSQQQISECPSWTRSGKYILFDILNNVAQTPPQIFRIGGTGGAIKPISKNAQQYNSCPNSNPGGKKIAFQSYDSTGQYAQIGVMNSDGTGAKTVLSKAKTSFFTPKYSPDGQWLAANRVTYDGQGNQQALDIVLLNLSTNKLTNLTNNTKAQFIGENWDPNGKGLVTVKNEQQVVRLFLNGAASQKVTSVSGQNVEAVSPVFAPTRNRIAYISCQGDCGTDPGETGTGTIYTVKKNGQGAKKVLTNTAQTQIGSTLDWGKQPPS